MTAKYPSRYSPERQVTPVQYVAEYMCEHIATLEKKDLPTQFWKDKAWGNLYRREVVFCNQLVKRGYHPRAIFFALKDKRCFPVKMLCAFWKMDHYKKILDEHQRKVIALETSKIEVTKGADTTQKPNRPVSSRRSKMNKLKGL